MASTRHSRPLPEAATEGRAAWLSRRPRWLVALVLALPPLLVVLVDFSLRGERLLGLGGKHIASYGAAVVESAVLWGLLLASASARQGVFRWVAAALFVLFATLAVGGQIYFHSQYATYLNLDATLFGTSFTDSMLGQLSADSVHFFASVGPAFAIALGLVWAGRRLVRTQGRSARATRYLAPVVVVAVFLVPCSYRSVQASTPDVIYFHSIGGLFRQLAGERHDAQVRPGRRSPPALPPIEAAPTAARNVLFILTEGIRADVGCSAPNEPCTVMPATDAAVPDRLPFLQLRSNSSTTAVQLSVLWSGLEPRTGREELHTAPLIFDYAHAAGIASAYWTSHHMMFANSRLYVQDLPTRFQCGATHLDPLADIDLGADDRLLTARVKQELPELGEPFYAVVQYGNTHVPYLIDSEDAPFLPESQSRGPDDNEAYRNRYKNAVYYQDKTIADLLRFVRQAPFGPRTVVIFTSDHGEAFREHGQLGHTASVFDVEIRVPGWIDAPPGTLSEAERAALVGYRDEPVFHSDLCPTVLDLMGLWSAPALERYRASMIGHSLLRSGRPAELVALTNCTAIWGCAFQNWGVMQGWRKLLAREWETSWLCFDLREDPEEKKPLAPEACADLAERAEQIYGGLPGRI